MRFLVKNTLRNAFLALYTWGFFLILLMLAQRQPLEDFPAFYLAYVSATVFQSLWDWAWEHK